MLFPGFILVPTTKRRINSTLRSTSLPSCGPISFVLYRLHIVLLAVANKPNVSMYALVL